MSTQRWKLWVTFVMLSLFAGALAANELRYALFSRTIDAQISGTDITTSRSRRGGTSHSLQVNYHFSDSDGSRRLESDKVSVNWAVPKSGLVAVQYVPGWGGASRIRGNSMGWLLYILLPVSAVLGFILYRSRSVTPASSPADLLEPNFGQDSA